MASAIAGMIATTVKTVLETFGVAVTYTASESSTDTSITAAVTDHRQATVSTKETKTFIVDASDIATPRRGDVITEADSSTWTIDEIDSPAQDTFWILRGT